MHVITIKNVNLYLNVKFYNVKYQSQGIVFAFHVFNFGKNIDGKTIRLPALTITPIHVVSKSKNYTQDARYFYTHHQLFTNKLNI